VPSKAQQSTEYSYKILVCVRPFVRNATLGIGLTSMFFFFLISVFRCSFFIGIPLLLTVLFLSFSLNTFCEIEICWRVCVRP